VGLSSKPHGLLLILRGTARLAEDGEGVSEAVPGGEAEKILPCRDMVDFADETIRPKEEWWRRKCRSFVSAKRR
jgi:hypothetical protein